MSLIRGISPGRRVADPVGPAEDAVGEELVVEPAPACATAARGRRGCGCSAWPAAGRCAGTSTSRSGGSPSASSSNRSSASSQSIGASWASRVNSGSTSKVTAVRMPRAPSPSRATSSTSGFSSGVGPQQLAAAGDQLEARHLGAERGDRCRRCRGCRWRSRRRWSARRCRPCCAGSGRASPGALLSSCERRAGEGGHGHRVLVDADDAAQAGRAQQEPVGERRCR